jgi:hypothetical protein
MAILASVDQAGRRGDGLPAVEGSIFRQLLTLGPQLLERFVGDQGSGDLGATARMSDERTVGRLDGLFERTYRSIFGNLTLRRTVYGTRAGQKHELAAFGRALATAGRCVFLFVAGLRRVLEGESRYVRIGQRQIATKRDLADAPTKAIDRICTYLEANEPQLRYDVYLAAGYPIASGVLEGVCRHFVKDRMERLGNYEAIQNGFALVRQSLTPLAISVSDSQRTSIPMTAVKENDSDSMARSVTFQAGFFRRLSSCSVNDLIQCFCFPRLAFPRCR